MRPVNLIPPDERRGDSAPLRTGKLVYVLVAGMALLLLGVIALALTSKQVSDRQEEKANLEQELNEATARANSLAAFSSFRAVQQSRVDTVTSLAQSRFDWDRVLHELSLVLPSDVSVCTLKGTVTPDVDVETPSCAAGAGGTDLRSAITGPALEITGCAPDQPTVAAFVASLEDIDGVTRVGLATSGIPDSEDDSSGAGDGGSATCHTEPKSDGRTRNLQFSIVVAFDAVATPPTAASSPSVPAPVAPSAGDTQQVASTQTPGS
jgi:Tfp pilus assembly protein PilN